MILVIQTSAGFFFFLQHGSTINFYFKYSLSPDEKVLLIFVPFVPKLTFVFQQLLDEFSCDLLLDQP